MHSVHGVEAQGDECMSRPGHVPGQPAKMDLVDSLGPYEALKPGSPTVLIPAGKHRKSSEDRKEERVKGMIWTGHLHTHRHTHTRTRGSWVYPSRGAIVSTRLQMKV